MFIGAIPMGFATIVNSFALMLPSDKYPWAPHTAFVLWWVDVFLMAFSVLVVPFFMATKQTHSMEKMLAVWLLPIVPAVVTAASGGVVAGVLDENLANLVVISSYVIWGMGVPLAVCIISVYFSRLAFHSLPPPELLISVYLPLGPLGQGAFGIMTLGTVAAKIFPTVYPELTMFGPIAEGLGLIIGAIMWGFGLFWLVQACAQTCYGMIKHVVRFNMGWWAFTFPLGVYISATNALGKILGAPFFKVLGSIYTVCLFLIWLFVFTRTVLGALSGALFVDPSLAAPVLAIVEHESTSASEQSSLAQI
ncbi:Sulfite efflux pump SSU1 [Zancudomyces culisetae]|uniref:Sulfite efflux pump SSU1 n=1 Tax=Zancudomyces culisetae TaxID=1213189 RepID=A0A1R1PWX0_ZANCU|nr:Sulfite efflux pump SSU1 [Zancudomyces culisetae]|eukprot:OMH85486.1 Sulfite efflux pump SSU1 [Zancudomyces culisetae]